MNEPQQGWHNWGLDQENRYIDSTAANYPNSLHGGSKENSVYVSGKRKSMKPLVKGKDGILRILEEIK